MSSSRRRPFESPHRSTQHHPFKVASATNSPSMTSWMKRKLHASTEVVRKEANFWAGDETLVVPSDAVESLFDVTLEGLDFEGVDDLSPMKSAWNGMGSGLLSSPLRTDRPSSGPIYNVGLPLEAESARKKVTQHHISGSVSTENRSDAFYDIIAHSPSTASVHPNAFSPLRMNVTSNLSARHEHSRSGPVSSEDGSTGSSAFYDIIAHAQRPSSPSIRPNAFSPLRMNPFSASRNEIVNSVTWTRTTTRPGPKVENAHPPTPPLPTRLISHYASMANPRQALFIPTLSSNTFSVYPRISDRKSSHRGGPEATRRQAHSMGSEKEIPKIVVNGPGPGEEVDMNDGVDARSDSMVEEAEVLDMLLKSTDDSDTDATCGDTNSLGRESFCVPEDSCDTSSSQHSAPAPAPTSLKFESPKTETKIGSTGPLRTHRHDMHSPSTPLSIRVKISKKDASKKVRPSAGAENIHPPANAVAGPGLGLVSPERFMGSISAASASTSGRDEYVYDLRQPRSTPRRDRDRRVF